MRRLFISLWMLATLGGAAAVTTNNVLDQAVSTRNFRVTGLDGGNNSVVAMYAEEALARSARLTGLVVRDGLFPPIRITLAVDTNRPEQRVTKSQRMVDGLLDQRIGVLNPAHADTEDFLEALSWVLLNRLAVQAQTHLTMPSPPRVPEWLSVGLAQNLFSEYPLRNRQVALRRWQQGRSTRLAELLNWQLLSEGRWADKAICGEAVEWFLNHPERTAILAGLLARTMEGQPITPAWLAQHLPESTDVRGLEKNWDLWVLHWEDAVPSLGAVTRQQTDALRDLLKIDPRSYGGDGKAVATALSPDDLIKHRMETWVRRLAEQVGAALQNSGMGRPVEFRQVLAAYMAFFDALADVPPRSWFLRLVHRPAGEKKLRALLAAADHQLVDLEQTLDQRRSYMTDFERKLQRGTVTNAAVTQVNPVLPEILSLWPSGAPVGDGSTETNQAVLTVYRPAPRQANGAALVICPGGGYAMLMKGPEGHGIAQWLAQHGMVGAVLEYRLPHGRCQVPLLDAQRAIRTVRARAQVWNLQPDHIGIMGFSAGGHLAATAGTHFDGGDPQAADPIARISSRPDFMVLVYPVITMQRNAEPGSRRNLLGPDPQPAMVKLFSNEEQVTKNTPPAFLAHARDDTVVSPDDSRNFYKALRAHHVAAEYLELPEGGHGLNGYKGPMWQAWQTKSLAWLVAQKIIPARDATPSN